MQPWKRKAKEFLSACLTDDPGKFCPEFRFGATELYDGTGENFSQRFAPYVHEGNVIPLSNEFERAYSDISRNGNAKIIFTDLCIKVMQNIRPN